jgi:hypothetical protein
METSLLPKAADWIETSIQLMAADCMETSIQSSTAKWIKQIDSQQLIDWWEKTEYVLEAKEYVLEAT